MGYGEQWENVQTATPADLLEEGQAHQLAGRLRDAAESYAQAIDIAGGLGTWTVMAEGLRRLGIIHHLQGETATGTHYCDRSREAAMKANDPHLAAEATMALGNMAREKGRIDEARALYQAALELAPGHRDLATRVEQNLGIVESVQGNLVAALEHYRRALKAHELAGNILGCARSHHNIGMICADQKEWTAAHRAYEQAASLAGQCGDYHLKGLCLLNQAEIDMAHHRYEEVRYKAEAAMGIFDRLGARAHKADALRTLGTALRRLGQPTLAESRLRSALEIAMTAGVPLTEAESCRDLGILFAETGRNREALGFMDSALAMFEQLGAVLDSSDVSERRAMLMAA